MSAFVMVLAAGIVVGSGPEAESAEMEQRLDLRGEWEGSCREEAVSGKAGLSKWGLCLEYPRAGGRPPPLLGPFPASDEGSGKARFWGKWGTGTSLGIYKWEADRLIICLGENGAARPTSFHTGSRQTLIILQRIQPGK
jgi:hypothetical protein